MYLYKKTYVKSWDFHKPEDRHDVTVTRGGKPVTKIKKERVVYVVEEVGYWRKFNALHAWFVSEVQGDVDECQESYVDREDLLRLLATLVEVQKNPEKAEELLPAQSGFFFGGTDYDEYYFESVSQTIELLENLLAEGEGEYSYRASW